MTFKDTIDLASSICLDEYFGTIYPGFPVMKTKITRKNQAENVRAAFDYFAGRKNQQATLMLQSFGLLDGDKIRPEGSKYASYYIDMIKKLQPQGVLNYSDIFQPANDNMFEDKEFRISFLFTPIIFLSLVYAGHAVITLKDGSTITASTLDKVPKTSVLDLYEAIRIAGRRYGTDHELATLGLPVMLYEDMQEASADIISLDGQLASGIFPVTAGKKHRLMFACILASCSKSSQLQAFDEEDAESTGGVPQEAIRQTAQVNTAISIIIAQQIVMMSVVAASAASNSSH